MVNLKKLQQIIKTDLEETPDDITVSINKQFNALQLTLNKTNVVLNIDKDNNLIDVQFIIKSFPDQCFNTCHQAKNDFTPLIDALQNIVIPILNDNSANTN